MEVRFLSSPERVLALFLMSSLVELDLIRKCLHFRMAQKDQRDDRVQGDQRSRRFLQEKETRNIRLVRFKLASVRIDLTTLH